MHYHIVGIAGSGMSAIAHVLLDQGHSISGSDTQRNALADALAERGAAIWPRPDPARALEADALVVTSAARSDQPEIAAAREHGIPVLKRADLWRDWSARRDVIAIAGTHGKTTTTALIALMLTKAGRAPGFLIGGETPDLDRNARWGDEQAPLVIEADEYDRTFLALAPKIAVITNVEWDHVDIYPTQAEYDEAFRSFASAVPEPRNLIVCGDDLGALRAAAERPRRPSTGSTTRSRATRSRAGARCSTGWPRARGPTVPERPSRSGATTGAASRRAAWDWRARGCTASTMSATRWQRLPR